MADDSGRINQVLAETSFLYGANAGYVEDLYARWAGSPDSVDPSWRAFFSTLRDKPEEARRAPADPAWTPRIPERARDELTSALDGVWPSLEAKLGKQVAAKAGPAATPEAVRAATLDSIRALHLIRAYRMRGHLAANLDPLGIAEKPDASELDPAHYGFTEADLDRPIFLDFVLGLETAPLREILAILRRTYCGNLGVQYMHIS